MMQQIEEYIVRSLVTKDSCIYTIIGVGGLLDELDRENDIFVKERWNRELASQ